MMYGQVGAVGLLSLLSFAAASETTTISATTSWGKWEGWGVSLAWWGAKFGSRDDLADIFFSTSTTKFSGVSLPGLGFNIARYNAGACSSNKLADGSKMVVSPNIISSHQLAGFWLNPTSSSPTSSSWDWTVDANQRAMVTKAQSRGANHIDLFSNSPMWWMCINHNPSGNDVKGANNLAPAYYDTHAVYLASIALEAKNSWGVTFASVEAFNEPSASYWVGNTSNQEGCHFDHASQQSVAIYLRKELNSRGLSSIIVSASDETSYDSATSTWNSFNSTVKASIGRVNVHGYQYEGGNRAALYTAVSGSGKKLWNTEYGEDDGTGKRMVTNLMLDLTELHPTAWVCWQALDRVGWGLIAADVQAGTVGAVSRKYYVLAQFTRHIREGMTILSGGSSYTIAAYDSTNSKLVIVAVNWGDSQSITFDLSKFKQGGVSGALVKRWATQIGTSGIQYVAYSDTYLSGTKFSSTFAADELMTFEVSNVTL